MHPLEPHDLQAPRTHFQSNTQRRADLALAYHICAYLGIDDHTYTHLSARDAMGKGFFILPFGLRFEEVSADNLLHVSLEGHVLEGKEAIYNPTGYLIHGQIYQARPDLHSIFHLHTPATVAVSSMKDGLAPISQWALHFYDKIAYHAYHSLVLSKKTSSQLIQDLGQRHVMLLRNHGSLTCGKTIHEAMYYTYHLEQACKTQCLMSPQAEIETPSHATCAKAVTDLLSFEDDLGARDWNAWKRVIERQNIHRPHQAPIRDLQHHVSDTQDAPTVATPGTKAHDTPSSSAALSSALTRPLHI